MTSKPTVNIKLRHIRYDSKDHMLHARFEVNTEQGEIIIEQSLTPANSDVKESFFIETHVLTSELIDYTKLDQTI